MLVSRVAIAIFAAAVVQACSSGNGNEAGGTSSGGSGSGSGSVGMGSDASMGIEGSDGSSSADAVGPEDSGSEAGIVAMTSPPQVINPAPMGPVLTAPKVQLIGYTEDTYLPDIEAQLVELTKTQTWAEQTSEYGVGPLTINPTILIPGTPPQTLDDNTGNPTPFETTLANNLSGATPVWGAADPSTIYLFVLPSGTQIDSSGLCCDPTAGYFGYHWQTPVGSEQIAYAVVCNCPNFVMAPLTAIDDLTTTVTHELDEAATDPFSDTSPAFSLEDTPHAIWEVGTFGGEVADMCQDSLDSNYTPPGSTYAVQRSWSDSAAKAGTNPCVPVPTGYGPYFNSYPTLPDMVTLGGTDWGAPITVPGVLIPVGGTKTIEIVLQSEAPTSGPWTVTATDLSSYQGASAATELTLDKSSGQSGDVLHLTIKVLAKDPTLGGEGFLLSSTLRGQNNLWFAAVGQ
jgi:hypothetical protein